MAQILEPEENEVVALQLADADLIQCWQQLLTGCEVAARERGHIHISTSVMVEPLVDVEMTSDRRNSSECCAIQRLALRA